MPKTAVAQKQKKTPKVKTSSRSPFESANVMRQEDSDVEMNNDAEGDADEEAIREKDETEKKLERMLFGDDEGFQGALKSQQDRGLMDWGMSDEDSAGEGGEEEGSDREEKGLEGVDDSDVCRLGRFPCDRMANVG